MVAICISAQSHAQVTSSLGTNSSAGAMAVNGGTTVVIPGVGPVTGGPSGGGIGNATWVMGQTTGGNNVTSYDACLKNAQLTVLFAAVAIPLEISHCWELRDMEHMAKFPPGSLQYEHGCRDSSWLNTDWVSGTMACTANKAKLAKMNKDDPRAQQVRATPVVMPGMQMNSTSPPPTVVPVSNTNQSISQAPAVDYSRKCNRALGILDQCTG
jgi:hypothetical protein